jgi:viroplasmin and RNaseH domain-containing protein
MSEFGIIIYVDGDYRIKQMKSGFQVYKLDIPIGETLKSIVEAISFINKRKEKEM